MLYLALGGAVLAAYLWVTGGRPMRKRREWRLPIAALALAAFTAAAVAGVRGGWAPAIVLSVVGLWLAASARQVGPAKAPTLRMSDLEARQILGVEADASQEDIQAAYARLMRRAHPDAGGTHGLAAQINAARDRLARR